MKFYLTKNATQLVAGIKFEPYSIFGGALFGVYATENADEIKKLDELVGQKKIYEQTAEDHAACLKKKPKGSVGSVFSNPVEALPEFPIKGQTAAVVINPGPAEVEAPVAVKTIETAEDALKLSEAPIAPAAPEPAPVEQLAVESPEPVTTTRRRNR